MGYYWLNQRREGTSGYNDKEGVHYHYRDNVANSKQFSEGDWFVYYRPGEHVLFGAGQVAKVEIAGETEKVNNQISSKLQSNVPYSKNITDYLAHMKKYRQFDPPISARDIKNEISFLSGKKGLTGVPQNSIYSISREDYIKILQAGDEEDLVKQ